MVPFNWGVLSDPNFPTVHFAIWSFIICSHGQFEMTVQVVVTEGDLRVKNIPIRRSVGNIYNHLPSSIHRKV